MGPKCVEENWLGFAALAPFSDNSLLVYTVLIRDGCLFEFLQSWFKWKILFCSWLDKNLIFKKKTKCPPEIVNIF
jgi:hypothetical protein